MYNFPLFIRIFGGCPSPPLKPTTTRYTLVALKPHSVVTYLLSETSDDGNSDLCASAVVKKKNAKEKLHNDANFR